MESEAYRTMTGRGPPCKVFSEGLSKIRCPVRLLVAGSPIQEHPMQYLCLIYGQEQQASTMSGDDRNQMRRDYMAYTEDIKKSNHYLGGNALQPTSTASTVRLR